MATQRHSSMERVSRIEGAYEQVDERLGELTAAVKDLRSEMHREIRMLYLFIGGSWVTLMATMLGLYLAR